MAASGYLTTHVLDTASGTPAAGMRIDLYELTGDDRRFVVTMHTNADGRTDSQILPQEDFRTGTYELVFHAGPYLDALGAGKSDHRFLDIVPIRFGIDDPTSHYHVPLLISPFGYSTYRGS
jgi:5-hydroxyisourate hydrolase